MNINQIISLLTSYKFTLYDEKTLQKEIQDVFDQEGVEYEREKRLDQKSIIDFMINGIGIEVKIKGTKKDIYYQCMRYCNNDQIEQILLVTNKAMGLPESIGKKPCYVLNLGVSWL